MHFMKLENRRKDRKGRRKETHTHTFNTRLCHVFALRDLTVPPQNAYVETLSPRM